MGSDGREPEPINRSPTAAASEPLEQLPSVGPSEVLSGAPRAIIDLRSPSEFAEDHLPGAVNHPLFDDDQRRLIGTLYRRESPERAFEQGVEITELRIAELVEAIGREAGCEELGGDVLARMRQLSTAGKAALEGSLESRALDSLPSNALVVHCWRGGLRSMSVAALLRSLGVDAILLDGGYRAYRRHVFASLGAAQLPERVFVLHGLTGVGKTLVLRELERQRPGTTIDLELAAGHRSSILGMVGLEPVSQKQFESRLFERLRAGFPEGFVVYEGESRKVGDVIIPDALWTSMRRGVSLELTAPVARRVDVLERDYLARPDAIEQLTRQLPFIEQRLGRVKWKGALVDMLHAGNTRELVATLLERYYDPLYEHSQAGLDPETSFDAGDPADCAARIGAWIDSHAARGA